MEHIETPQDAAIARLINNVDTPDVEPPAMLLLDTSDKELKKQEAKKSIGTGSILANGLAKSVIDDMFFSWQESQPPREGLHASSVLAASAPYCHREHVLSTLHIRMQPIHNPHTLAIFMNGWSLHEKWQKLFQIAGVALEVEQSHIDSNYGLHFTPDAIIQLSLSGVPLPYIIEIKGYRQETFLDIDPANPWKSSAEYRKAHIQANLYMYMLNIPRAIVLIENKNNQFYMAWVIDYSQELAEPYVKRMETLNTLTNMYHVDKKLVARIPECKTIDSTRARKCTVRNACFLSKEDRLQVEGR